MFPDSSGVAPRIWREVWPGALYVAAIAAPCLLAVIAVHRLEGVPIRILTQDPTVVAGVPAYAGFLSNAGVVLWSATAAMCLLTASVATAGSSEAPHGFLLSGGLLTSVIALDDLFLLHETVVPRLFGVPELAVYAAYALAGAAFVVRFRSVVLQPAGAMLDFALLCLAASVALDVLEPAYLDRYLLEDGTKFVGIVAWFVYFARACRRALDARS